MVGILDQSAVWVDEMNYYDMRTDRNKGIPPLSLRPANPLGIEIEKWVPALPPLSLFLAAEKFCALSEESQAPGTSREAQLKTPLLLGVGHHL